MFTYATVLCHPAPIATPLNFQPKKKKQFKSEINYEKYGKGINIFLNQSADR